MKEWNNSIEGFVKSSREDEEFIFEFSFCHLCKVSDILTWFFDCFKNRMKFKKECSEKLEVFKKKEKWVYWSLKCSFGNNFEEVCIKYFLKDSKEIAKGIIEKRM